MKQKLYLLTENDGFFGQGLHPWQSLKVDEIERILSAIFDVTRITWMQISSGIVCPSNSIIVHSSSQQQEYKCFIDDLLLYLFCAGNHLVPSIHATRSHDNKGYQELHKRLLGITSLQAIYACKPEELPRPELENTIVFKEISGYGSSGVKLVHSKQELERIAASDHIAISWRELFLFIRRRVGRLVRWVTGRYKPNAVADHYHQPLKRFILQEFIPDLAGDYKVIAFQDAFFVLKRSVPANDFRASGSGLFEYIDPPVELLEFSKDLIDKFNEPYMSFDIAEKDGGFFLLEFQGLHFGPYTVIHADYYYLKEGGEWKKIKKEHSFEAYLANSLVKQISGIVKQ